jgi:hypothetical protein
MGRAWSKHGREEEWIEKVLMESDHQKCLDVDESIPLKWALEKQDEVTDWIRLAQDKEDEWQ